MAPRSLDEILPGARFREQHRRTVEAPVATVWQATLGVTPREVRLLGPLMAVRTLPGRFRNRGSGTAGGPQPLLETIDGDGFVLIDRDDEPIDGRARVVMGAAGRFWSPARNQPMGFDTAEDFFEFDEPGFAKAVFDLTVCERDGRVDLSTETIIAGTDARADKAFGRYWALIRLPSGLIRRSWLAAIERRALGS